jgi:hypothetical protein
MELLVSPRRISRFIGLVILGLTTASFLMKLVRCLSGIYLSGYRLLDLDAEQTIPSWYSSSLLLLCAGLLALIAQAKNRNADPYRFHWSLLSIIFVGLSIDEAVSIHEEAIGPLRTMFNFSGLLYFNWVIPGMAFVGLFALLYLKFLFHLPATIRRLFFISAVVYVSGAIGLEMIGGMFWQETGPDTLLYQTTSTLEELFEMLGIDLFVYALMSYLAVHLGIRVCFAKEKYSGDLN